MTRKVNASIRVESDYPLDTSRLQSMIRKMAIKVADRMMKEDTLFWNPAIRKMVTEFVVEFADAKIIFSFVTGSLADIISARAWSGDELASFAKVYAEKLADTFRYEGTQYVSEIFFDVTEEF